jgi:NADP-dependent alcohol dehydrogenase
MLFSYHNPTRILFGKGQIAALADLVDPGARVLLLYGGGSIRRNGVYDQVVRALGDRVRKVFSGVEPNPHKETLDKAAALVREHGLDLILAVGGGSVIDGAKYVAAAARYDGDGWDIPTRKHTVREAVALGAVLTLPATGSESNAGAVITRAATGEKLPFHSPAVQPLFAVLDPDTMKTLPERQLVNGIVDSFVHVCEQYLTRPTGALVQDGYSEALLRALAALAGDFAGRDDDLWRANLMWAANQGLNGLVGAGVPQDWATHMIGHEITARYGLDHAVTLALVQPWLLRARMQAKGAKLEQMGRAVFGLEPGPELAERTVQAIEALYRSLGIPAGLRAAGVEEADAPDRLAEALRRHGMTALGEDGGVTPEVARAILTRAL